MRAAATLLERYRKVRDRWLLDARFIRWVERFPLTQPIARRHAAQLFDLCAGFTYTQILLASVRLGLLETLRRGPRDAVQLSLELGVPKVSLQRLLEACEALRLLERRGKDCFGLGRLGALVLTEPGLLSLIEHNALLYTDLADPVNLLRGKRDRGRLGRYWAYAREASPAGIGADRVRAFSELMTTSQDPVAREVLNAHDFREHHTLLDVGGGEGSFLRHAAARFPHLSLMLFDLPPVIERARQSLEEHGFADRIALASGDFRYDSLPRGADVMTLIRVLHDHNDGAALAILRAACLALPENGTLLVAEPMCGLPGAPRVGEAYMNFYLLAMGQGRARTPREIGDLLRTAGFRRVRLRRTRVPIRGGLIEARR